MDVETASYDFENDSELDTESSLSDDEDATLLTSHINSGYEAIVQSSGHHNRKGGILSSVFTLVSTMIGGGLLSLPFAYEQGGFAVGSVVLVFVLAASTYGGFLIINSKKYCSGRVKNIEDVAKVAFGKKGQLVAQILLIILLYLCTVAYFILITDQMEPILIFAVGPGTVWSKKLTLLSFVLAVVFPISLLKNLSALKYTSSLSVICGVLLCCCVVYRSVKSDLGGPIYDQGNPVKWHPLSVRELLTCISIAELTFSCHFNILPMHSELRNQTRKNKRLILFLAMGITYVMNFIISFFGYFQFRRYTDQDITKNYRSDDVVVTCGRAALCLLLILSYPLLVVPCRATLNKMFWHNDRSPSKFALLISNERLNGPNKFVWFIETVVLVGTSYLLAYLVPQVNMVWGFVGSVGCTTLIYILPPAFYLRVRHHPARADIKKISAVILLISGLFMLVAGLYQSILNIISPLPQSLPYEDITINTNFTLA
ncbi:sodium-coupled neutral amino acid transporter 5-like [Hydractinia symbiolongicarpus]|uniref:sodium-coupled neutral amino acid transporter 5-like n=1 Tax=Hydractinia symbiolongicarpus TaxID=13093 RepID=UPI00254AC3BD|nr:sodium-coupled neutral amino acid transporter 5-like [Hydractinia symbiolongicarpus]